MSFPSKFPGRCRTCQGPIRLGELINYDKAIKKATHATCGATVAPPMEGREPEESLPEWMDAGPTPKATRRARPKLSPEDAHARIVEHGRADIVLCHRCGGSSKDGRPMLHVACIDQDDLPL